MSRVSFLGDTISTLSFGKEGADMKCKIIQNHFGSKWFLPVFQEISLGKFTGFNDFLKKSGTTPRILSKQLKQMEEEGIIKRVEGKKTLYSITKKGEELKQLIDNAKKFNIKWENVPDACTNSSCVTCSNFKSV